MGFGAEGSRKYMRVAPKARQKPLPQQRQPCAGEASPRQQDLDQAHLRSGPSIAEMRRLISSAGESVRGVLSTLSAWVIWITVLHGSG
jgi:hypothetical protein